MDGRAGSSGGHALIAGTGEGVGSAGRGIALGAMVARRGARDWSPSHGHAVPESAGGPGQNRTATAEGEGFTDPWAHHLPDRPTIDVGPEGPASTTPLLGPSAGSCRRPQVSVVAPAGGAVRVRRPTSGRRIAEVRAGIDLAALGLGAAASPARRPRLLARLPACPRRGRTGGAISPRGGPSALPAARIGRSRNLRAPYRLPGEIRGCPGPYAPPGGELVVPHAEPRARRMGLPTMAPRPRSRRDRRDG